MSIASADALADTLRDDRCPHRDLPGGLGCWNCVRDALLHNEHAARDLVRDNARLQRELDEERTALAAYRATLRVLRARLETHQRPQEART